MFTHTFRKGRGFVGVIWHVRRGRRAGELEGGSSLTINHHCRCLRTMHWMSRIAYRPQQLCVRLLSCQVSWESFLPFLLFYIERCVSNVIKLKLSIGLSRTVLWALETVTTWREKPGSYFIVSVIPPCHCNLYLAVDMAFTSISCPLKPRENRQPHKL